MSDAAPFIGLPTSQDTARLVFAAPYFDTIPVAEMLAPAVEEAAGPIIAELLPPLMDDAIATVVNQQAVLKSGSTMTGPLNLSPLMPTGDYMAATKAYVDTMISTAGVPEVPAVPVGQSWMRQTGQWVAVPASAPGGPFLALAGGTMAGQINMAGNAINNLSSIPNAPNGAAPRQWVLDQIAAVSLYQGTWNLDTNTPDLSAAQYRVNGYTWIAVTTNSGGVVIGPAVPGLQGKRVFNGDHVTYSSAQGTFTAIQNVGLTVGTADARYVALAGSTMTGALVLSGNATQPLHAVTLQQLQAFVPPGAIPEAPTSGQIYGRGGTTPAWQPVLPIAGGVLTGSLSLNGNATLNLQAVPLQQLVAQINSAVNNYLPLGGGSMTGLMTLSGNAGANLNPVPLQQLNSMLASYVTTTSLTTQLGSYVLKAGDQMTGQLTVTAASGAANLLLRKVDAADSADILGQNQASVARWVMSLADNDAESSGNVGSSFRLHRFDDAGAYLGAALAISRATGAATFAAPITIDAAGTLWSDLNLNAASTEAARVMGTRNGSPRWDVNVVNTDSEAGSNSGSNFHLGRYSDTGTFLGFGMQISRATGNAVFGGQIASNVGYQPRAGTSGPGRSSNNYNIDWTGIAELWIDNVKQGQFAWVCDYRIKENVADLPSTWDRVKALRPISYMRADNAELLTVADPTERWGFLAHELQEALTPSAASGHKDAPNEVQSPDPLALFAGLTRALQEAMQRIEALEKQPTPKRGA